ncbi:hypothetical protein [Orlajensenia leifsoniae]|uniref:Uncharacterized protein n=1 Tax=Orlajensenia leifsoniae TaxID=2561933 RepID=A0A4Y9QT86_9MICO|nr:hypothetical protein [Leifsonia flava]TFV94882.1 hypothetical protein E4M00_17160 [Leifsonia flava]
MPEPFVTLPGRNEAPTWGAPSIDDQITKYKEGPLEQQSFIFKACAGSAFANRFKHPGAFDHSDTDEWLHRLGEWFSWTDDQIAEAMKEAARVDSDVSDWEFDRPE